MSPPKNKGEKEKNRAGIPGTEQNPQTRSEEQKKRKKRRARIRRGVILTVFAALFAVTALNWDRLSPVAVMQRCQAIANSKGERLVYPADIAQHKVGGFAAPDGFGFIAAETGCFILKDSAAYFYSYKMTSPVVKAGVRNAAVYEYGGNKYAVFSADGLIFSRDAKSPLKSMAVAKNGIYALLTCPTQFSCEFTVYSVSHKVLASQYFSEPYITDITLSSSAQSLAVSRTVTENGRIFGVVTVYDTRLVDPVFTAEYEGELILDMRYDKNDELRVVTDRAAYFYNSEPELTLRYEYEAELVSFCVTTEGNIAVMMDTQSMAAGKIVAMFGKSAQIYSVNTAYNSGKLWADNRSAVFMSGQTAVLLDSAGEIAGRYDCETQIQNIILSGKSVYFYDGREITRAAVSGFQK